MEGFLKIRLKPWVRRILTRMIAIIPAAVVAGARFVLYTPLLALFLLPCTACESSIMSRHFLLP